MKILFDYQVFLSQPHGGVSRYFSELCGELARDPLLDVRIFAGCHVNTLLAKRASQSSFTVKGVRLPVRFGKPPFYRLFSFLNQQWFRNELSRFRPDIYHATYYKWLAPEFGGVRVHSVYDMTSETHSECFPRGDPTSARKRKAVKGADGVICISNATRQALIDIVPAISRKVVAIPLGCFPMTESRAMRVPPDPYFLYVGAHWAYKNFKILLHALAGSGLLRRQYNIISFGADMTDDEMRLASDLGIADRVRVVKGGDEVLAGLYRHATAFVYPSLSEGFGIPLLEAMMAKCPVIASDTPALREVGGDAALYFPPMSASDLARLMEQVASNDGRRAGLVEKGLSRAMVFSWQRTAEATKAFYWELVKDRTSGQSVHEGAADLA